MHRHLLFYIITLVIFLVCGAANAQITSPENLFKTSYRQFTRDTASVQQLIRESVEKRNNADSAILLLENAFAISENIGYTDGCATALLGIGTNYYNKGDLEKALAVFRRSLPYCQHALFNRNDLMLRWYNNMATPFNAQSRYDSASFYYYKALENIKATHRDSGMACLLYGNLGNLWLKQEQFKKSLFYSRKALAYAIALRDSDRIADAQMNLGLALSSSGDTANCKQPLRISYEIHVKRNNISSAEMACCALAACSTNNDSCLYYYNTALALSKRANMEPLHKIYLGLGYTYFQTGQYDLSAFNLKKALERARAQNFKGDIAFVYAMLGDVYTAQKKYDSANKYERAYVAIHDSLVNSERILSTNTLDVKYRTVEKDREIAATQLQLVKRDYKLKQKNGWIISISCIIAVLAVLLVTVYRSARRKVKFEQQQLLNVQQKQEISQLKSVMAGEEKERTRIARELHDGIMVQLAVIKMKIRKMQVLQQTDNENSVDDIVKQLDNTSRELRQTAHNLMPDMLLENGLTEALFYHCNSLQKETGLLIIFQHYGSLPRLTPEAELYLYRIIQELLQNVTKHAHATKALVQMNYHPPFLSFAVEDNGVGFDQDIMDAGMGLKSIYSRLRVLNGTIDIQSSKQMSTAIFIELNIEKFIQPKINEHATDTGSNSR